MNDLNWVSNSSRVDTNWRKGKWSIKDVDTDACVKFEHSLLPLRGMQIELFCVDTAAGASDNKITSIGPTYLCRRGHRIALRAMDQELVVNKIGKKSKGL